MAPPHINFACMSKHEARTRCHINKYQINVCVLGFFSQDYMGLCLSFMSNNGENTLHLITKLAACVNERCAPCHAMRYAYSVRAVFNIFNGNWRERERERDNIRAYTALTYMHNFHYRHSSVITNKALKLKYTKTNFAQS